MKIKHYFILRTGVVHSFFINIYHTHAFHIFRYFSYEICKILPVKIFALVKINLEEVCTLYVTCKIFTLQRPDNFM